MAVDYIENNLDRDFTLEEIAAVTGFSKYHFHRIFHVFTGETLFQFIQRLRLEKGATLLLNDPAKPIINIALECGFASSASFAKSFKQYFGCTATNWRNQGYATHMNESNLGKEGSNQGQQLRNTGKASISSNVYIEYANNTQIWRYELMENLNRVVEVKELPETTLAYVRYVGPYKGDSQLFVSYGAWHSVIIYYIQLQDRAVQSSPQMLELVAVPTSGDEYHYVASKNSKVFHRITCPHVARIKPKN